MQRHPHPQRDRDYFTCFLVLSSGTRRPNSCLQRLPRFLALSSGTRRTNSCLQRLPRFLVLSSGRHSAAEQLPSKTAAMCQPSCGSSVTLYTSELSWFHAETVTDGANPVTDHYKTSGAFVANSDRQTKRRQTDGKRKTITTPFEAFTLN